jgi:hypothetical protein
MAKVLASEERPEEDSGITMFWSAKIAKVASKKDVQENLELLHGDMHRFLALR